MSQLVISESQLKLNNQIQEQVILINNILNTRACHQLGQMTQETILVAPRK